MVSEYVPIVGDGLGEAEGLALGEGDGEELALVPDGFITIVDIVTGWTGAGGAVQETVTLIRL
jgi:hypothetical protein